jgi:hypothetical protein
MRVLGNISREIAEYVGTDGLTGIKIAQAAKENHARITSARRDGDVWRINLKAPIPGQRRLQTFHLGLNDQQAAGFLGVLGISRAERRKK